MVDAFDSDVLIYAAVDHMLGRPVRTLFDRVEPTQKVGIGSVVLVPEVLSKPLRDQATAEYDQLWELLTRLELHPADEQTAILAASLGAAYRLRGADAIHLATAVNAGADRFITNNRSDFTPDITEIDVVYPEQLE